MPDIFQWFGRLRIAENNVLVPIAAPAAPLCKQDPSRVGLVIAANSIAFFISTKPGVTTGTGIQVTVQQNPIIFSHDSHGKLCQLEWFAISAGAGSQAVVIEMFDDHAADPTGLALETANAKIRNQSDRRGGNYIFPANPRFQPSPGWPDIQFPRSG